MSITVSKSGGGVFLQSAGATNERAWLGFNAPTIIGVQSDGKIVCCGLFDKSLTRLNSNGSLDTGFDVGSGVPYTTGTIRHVAIQSDGKIICTGTFTEYNGVSRNGIARINSDGSLDTGFTSGSGFGLTGSGYYIVIQSDDKIICGGRFSEYRGVSRNSVTRINSNGTIDSAFDVGSGFTDIDGTIAYVRNIILLESDAIICGGNFSKFNNFIRVRVAKIYSDGTLA